MTFSDNIKSILSDKNISQTDLAKRLGVSRQHIWNSFNRWDNGYNPSITTLKKLATALNVDYKFLLLCL